ncbi:lipocalin family protein [uncultured Aquimarina sp.]|uniref:lipocalin family protein n=1 Tax=uncultured Aquimarina sp. TaxID=575652 RepID=UPI00262DDFFB|nr:lipocalin family protein [uncultured Aquimarina sp.]
MKKIILLLAISISACITSCKSDDDGAGPMETQDKFIGVWKITQEFEDGVEETVDACELLDVLTVTADQNFTTTAHVMENGSCVMIDDPFQGTWENLGDNVYKITPDRDQAEAIEATITFSGNTMTTVINDEDGEFIQILTRI